MFSLRLVQSYREKGEWDGMVDRQCLYRGGKRGDMFGTRQEQIGTGHTGQLRQRFYGPYITKREKEG